MLVAVTRTRHSISEMRETFDIPRSMVSRVYRECIMEVITKELWLTLGL